MGSKGVSREQWRTCIEWSWKRCVHPLSSLWSLAVLPSWCIFLNFSCFCPLAQLFQCTCQASICPSRASSDIPSSGGLSILLHHLLTRDVLLFAALAAWICQYRDNYYIVFSCLFPHLFESLWRTRNMALSETSPVLSWRAWLVQSVPGEVWLVGWSTDHIIHLPTQSGSGGGDGTVNFITLLPC